MLQLLKNRTLVSFALAHFCVDMCSGALAVFVIYYARSLQLSIAQSGFVIGAYTIVSSLTQPFFGYISDRWGGRWQSAAGLVCIAVFLGLTGYAPSYPALLGLVCMGGIGSAIFHPHGASGARKAEPIRKTLAMSVFMLGGNAGYALGPVLAAFAMSRFGDHGSLIVLAFGLLLTPVVVIYSTQRSAASANTAGNQAASAPATVRYGALAMIMLMLVMFFRAWTSAATTAFGPTYFSRIGGYDVGQASAIVSTYLFALTAGGVLGGILGDRLGGLRVLLTTLVLFGPFTFLMFWLQGPAALVATVLAGLVAGASWPPLLVMTQDAMPRRSGVASGLALGAAFAMGGIGVSITGVLAEPTALGLAVVIPLLGVLPLISAVLAIRLPGGRVAAASSADAALSRA